MTQTSCDFDAVDTGEVFPPFENYKLDEIDRRLFGDLYGFKLKPIPVRELLALSNLNKILSISLLAPLDYNFLCSCAVEFNF